MTAVDDPAEPAEQADAPVRTDGPSLRRRYLVASGLGALCAWLVLAVVLQSGRDGLFDRDLLGGFYDGQARALLDGHLDVDPEVAGFEGFRIGDETHIYQGLVPALLRVPVLLVTDAADGRLTGASMLFAAAIAMAYLVAAGWRARLLVRGTEPLGRGEGWLVGFATFALAAGPLVFVASRAWVYHEAIVWACAATLGSLTHLLWWLTPAPGSRARTGHLVAGVVLAGVALNSRSSMGLGPMLAASLIGAALLLALLPGSLGTNRAVSAVRNLVRRSTGWDPERTVRSPRAALAIVAVGVLAGAASYSAVNTARFGSPWTVPLDRQALVATDPARRAALDANGGSLFGLHYAPSVLVQAFRPDGLGVRAELPWLVFPPERPAVLGDAVFAERDWSSSVPASQPLLLLGAALGVATLAAPRWALRREDVDPIRPYRLVAWGAAASGAAIVVFGYMAQRYLTDLYPFLALTSVVGLHALWARLVPTSEADPVARHGRTAPAARIAAVVAVVLTGVWGVWANVGLALQYHREIAPGPTEAQRVRWVRTQARLGADHVPLELPSDAALPPREPIGRLAVTGDCDGLYRSNGTIWYRLEAGTGGGRALLTISPREELADPVVVARRSAGDEVVEVVLVPTSGGRARFAVDRRDASGTSRVGAGPELAIRPGTSLEVVLTLDHHTGEALVTDEDGQRLLDALSDIPGGALEVVGGSGVPVRSEDPPTPLCDELRG